MLRDVVLLSAELVRAAPLLRVLCLNVLFRDMPVGDALGDDIVCVELVPLLFMLQGVSVSMSRSKVTWLRNMVLVVL